MPSMYLSGYRGFELRGFRLSVSGTDFLMVAGGGGVGGGPQWCPPSSGAPRAELENCKGPLWAGVKMVLIKKQIFIQGLYMY